MFGHTLLRPTALAYLALDKPRVVVDGKSDRPLTRLLIRVHVSPKWPKLADIRLGLLTPITVNTMLAIRTGLSGPKFDGIDERDLSSSDPAVRLVCVPASATKETNRGRCKKSCDVLKRPLKTLNG